MDLNFEHNQTLFPKNYQNRFQIFYDLQKYKVNELLLVSSLYDDFVLEEDGRLTEELTEEFSNLELSSPPPRIIRVSTASEALEAIKNHDFDMIITMLRLSDMDPFSFGKAAKEIKPGIPVVLLLTHHSDTLSLPAYDERDGIDEIFTWNGDSDLFLAIIKLIEDRVNVDNDTELGKVRVIICVEDTINYFSIFLPIMYKELLHQTQEIMEEGLNLSHRLLRRRGRPKILLAQTFEEATTLYDKYKDYLLGIVTDVAFPYQDVKDYSAGVKLIKFVRTEKKHLPVLIQSSDPENDDLAKSFDAWFVHKSSLTYLSDFRKFLRRGMLFGDFIFRTGDQSKEINRAKNLSHFEEVIREVPPESIRYHGVNNHFSNWLYSRGEFKFADQLAPYEVDEFETLETLRNFLINAFEERRREKQRGVITDFSRETFDFTTPFTRIGQGSLGGKGRGIAFINSILLAQNLEESYDNVSITIPETVVLATDIFDLFIEENNLLSLLQEEIDDLELKKRFLESELPEGIRKDLKLIVKKCNTPLAVRSSSLLEDSQFHPLAGIYTTYMISNDGENIEKRYKILTDAVKLVYASAFTQEAKSFIRSMGQKVEVEKMAVIIMKVVGKRHEDRFYPDFSGVTKSYNYWPIRHMKPEQGIAEVAVGLGEMVVTGRQFLAFSPAYPKILPQASTVEMALKNSQREFLALRLNNDDIDLLQGEFTTLDKLPLSVAKEDGVLDWLGSVYDHENNRIVNSMRRDGPILITFPYILKYPKFPLAPILRNLLTVGKEALGNSVEIEFAVNLDYENEDDHTFYVLQIRPLVIENYDNLEDIEINPEKDFIIYSEQTLGNGVFGNITDIVYVDPDKFDKTKTMDIRSEISKLNKTISHDNDRSYLLIGPGRWGTRDRFLGIPTHWSDLDGASVIVEVALKDFQIEPSQGNHFFTNITSSKMGYFTVPYEAKKPKISWDWFEQQPKETELNYVNHIHLDEPLGIKINGKTGHGIIQTRSMIEKNNKEEKISLKKSS